MYLYCICSDDTGCCAENIIHFRDKVGCCVYPAVDDEFILMTVFQSLFMTSFISGLCCTSCRVFGKQFSSKVSLSATAERGGEGEGGGCGPVSDSTSQPMGSASACAPLPFGGGRGRPGEDGLAAREGSARRGEWMTSGGWRQHVWDWRVRSTQLGRDRTHSWLGPAFLHKTGL